MVMELRRVVVASVIIVIACVAGCGKTPLLASRPKIEIIDSEIIYNVTKSHEFKATCRNSGGKGEVIFWYEGGDGRDVTFPPTHFDANEERAVKFDIPVSTLASEKDRQFMIRWKPAD